MIIERNSTTTLKPHAFEALQTRQHITYYNDQWGLRKPLGIYNVSFTNILGSFRKVLDELEAVLQEQAFREIPPDKQWDMSLLKLQEDLISRLMRHFDDCFNILCCFFPRTTAAMDVKALEKDQKQVRKNPHVQTAWRAVTNYREHVANIINHIKHHQGTLRGIIFFNDDVAVPGYFVEHVNQNEVLEPYPEVHPEFEGQATAFSFHRDLRYKLWLVYAVGEHVADAIAQIEPTSTPNPNDLEDEDSVVDVISRIADLPSRLYKDEEKLPFPQIAITNENDITKAHMEFPGNNAILIPLSGQFRVWARWVGDGVTKSFRLPYRSNASVHSKENP